MVCVAVFVGVFVGVSVLVGLGVLVSVLVGVLVGINSTQEMDISQSAPWIGANTIIVTSSGVLNGLLKYL